MDHKGIIKTCPKPGLKPSSEVILERILLGWARMMVFVGITLLGRLRTEL